LPSNMNVCFSRILAYVLVGTHTYINSLLNIHIYLKNMRMYTPLTMVIS
jgi:hypothetical protein